MENKACEARFSRDSWPPWLPSPCMKTPVRRKSNSFSSRIRSFLRIWKQIAGKSDSCKKARQGSEDRGLAWCPRRGSNPHVFKGQRILSPSRLPFRHSGRVCGGVVTPWFCFCKGNAKTRFIKFLLYIRQICLKSRSAAVSRNSS